MVHFLNCMMFCVSVPVLSEKMYSIWPSCSFSVVVRAWRNRGDANVSEQVGGGSKHHQSV